MILKNQISNLSKKLSETFCLLAILSFPVVCRGDYFQQDVKYTIHVKLDDKKHILLADESIVYTNNSSTTLKELYFHIWPAAYQNVNTALAREIFKSGDDRMLNAKPEDLGYIDSLDFHINGDRIQWSILKDTSDVCKLILLKPLAPGDSITITTPFRIKIPAAFISRLGHDKQSYFITQWYPKPAVFDKKGWNYFPYLDQGEYYSEFGSFDVYITLPENYILAATGIRMNAAEEIKMLERNDSLTRTIKVFPEEDLFPPSSSTLKTIHFSQRNVHDFAWFADKRWHVLKNKITLKSGKAVTTWSFFNNKEASYWLKSPEIIFNALNYFSEWIGEYPYDEYSAIDVGNAMGNGMEYPMSTAIGNYGDPFELEVTLVHEVGHSWFYGILGSNERKHPWMDEGINNFLETRYVYSHYVNDSTRQLEVSEFSGIPGLSMKKINHRKNQYYKYLTNARTNLDQSPALSSEELSIKNYHGDAYFKSSISFDYLKYYLGDSLFDRSMQIYFDRWKFKHPQPEDFRKIVEETSSKNLDWFFQGLIGSAKKLNYRLTSSQFQGLKNIKLNIKNTGTIAGPIPISEISNGKAINTFWMEGFRGSKDTILLCSACKEFRIDNEERLPELYEKDNILRTIGFFRRMEKPQMSFAWRLENAKRTQFFYIPVIGLNKYNQFLPGIVIHNISVHEKKFEYRFMPLYGTGTKDLAGGGDISIHAYPSNSKIYRITLSSAISRYAYLHDEYSNSDFTYSHTNHFLKLNTQITFSLKQSNAQNHFKNTITIRDVFISKEIPYIYNYSLSKLNMHFFQGEFKRINTNPLEKSLEKVTITGNKELFTGTLELKKFICYDKADKGINLRFFGGYLNYSKKSITDYRMSLSGRTGERDYLFEEVFIGRTEETGITSKQFTEDYAGFKTPTSFFRLAQEYMFGINVNTTLPGLLPFRLFLNVGTFDRSDNQGEFEKYSWEAGVDIPIIKDIFVIYYPFAYSKDIKNAVEGQDLGKKDLLRFELHFNMLNPLDFIKTINE